MNYFKKLKGISVATEIKTGKNSTINTKGSFAISRGKFARQTIATKEGNQGPYRLQGNNNERFIIVLAGNPGTGKTHIAIGLGIKACQQNHKLLFY